MTSLARWCFKQSSVSWPPGWSPSSSSAASAPAPDPASRTGSRSPGPSPPPRSTSSPRTSRPPRRTHQVVFSADDVTAPETKAAITETLDKIAKLPHVQSVDSPFAQGAAARQIAKDKAVAFANVHMDGEQPIADVPKSAYDKLISTAEAARGNGLKVELGGSGIQQAQQQQGGGPSEFIGFIAAADRARDRLRLAVGDGAAPVHRGAGARLRHQPHRPAGSRDQDRDVRAAARDPDRARGRHRLLAVRRHPPPQRDQGGPRPRGGVCPRAQHLGPRRAVRGRRR